MFYSDQSKALSIFITILGLTLTAIFSIGAMITMNATVSSRIAEIGTLRALGFRRSGVLYAFMAESLLLGLAGGLIGLALITGQGDNGNGSAAKERWRTRAQMMGILMGISFS